MRDRASRDRVKLRRPLLPGLACLLLAGPGTCHWTIESAVAGGWERVGEGLWAVEMAGGGEAWLGFGELDGAAGGGELGEVADFVVEVEVRVAGELGGAGVLARARQEEGAWRGLLFRVGGAGGIAELGGRGELAGLGQRVVACSGGKRWLVGGAGELGEEGEGGWRRHRVEGRGNQLRHEVDGQLVAELVDHRGDPRAMVGAIGLWVVGREGARGRLELRMVGYEVLAAGAMIDEEETLVSGEEVVEL